MSDIPADWRDQLDLRAEIARIDRDRAESQKLQEEVRKFVAEQHKLSAEAAKLQRDRWLAPFVLTATLIGSLSGGLIVAVISHLWRIP